MGLQQTQQKQSTASKQQGGYSGSEIDTQVSSKIDTDIDASVGSDMNRPTPQEEAKKLLKDHKENYKSLVEEIAHRIPEDEELVKALIDEIGRSKSDNLGIAMIHGLDEYQLAITKPSILIHLQEIIDDFWGALDNTSDQTLLLIKRQLLSAESMPDLDYHKLADILKREFSKENKEAINHNAVQLVFDQIKYNAVAVGQIKLCYDGNLVKESSNTQWARYFMLKEVESDNQSEEDSAATGKLILVENSSSQTGKEFHYIVGTEDTLWDISQRYRIGIESLKELNKLDGDNPKLSINQHIKLPHNLYIPEDEKISAQDADGATTTLQRSKSSKNIDASIIQGKASELANLIVQDKTYINQDKIIEILKELEGNELAIRQLQAEYFTYQQVSLIRSMEKTLTDDNARMYDSHQAVFNSFRYLLRVTKVSEEDQQQRLINKEQDKIQQTNEVDLWDGLSIEILVDKAHAALLPALKRQQKEINVQNLLSTLASLRFFEANINEFHRLYTEKYGSFYTNLQKASEYTWTYTASSIEGYHMTGTSHSMKPQTKQAALDYLSPDHNLNITSIYLLKDISSDHQLKYNEFGDPMLKDQFANGSFIKYQKDDDALPIAYYAIMPNDSYWQIAKNLGIELNELYRLNNIIQIPQNNEIEGQKKSTQGPTIRSGDLIQIPMQFLTEKSYIHVVGDKVSEIAEGLESQSFLTGGTYQLHAESYNPFLIEQLLNSMICPDKGTGTGSVSFSLEVYIRGSVAFLVYLEFGLEGFSKASIDDDRWFTVTSKLKFGVTAGITGIGSVGKKLTILGHTNMFHSIKHFAALFNHDIYNYMLEQNEVMHGFVQYWDDDEIRANLQKDYVEKNVSAIDASFFSKKTTKSKERYGAMNAPEYVGDTESESKTERSEDFKEKNKVSKGNNVTTIELYDNDIMQVSLLDIKDDMNGDNIGTWMFVTLKITVSSLKKLYGIAKNGKGFLGEPTDSHIETVASFLSPSTSEYVKTVNTAACLANPKTYKSTFASLQEEHLGKNGLGKTKISADGGVSIKFCFQEFNNSWVYQYVRASIIGEMEVDKRKLIYTNGLVALTGGVRFGAKYERSLYESPAPGSLSYVSTLYNGFMQQKDTDMVKDERTQKFKEAQEKRLKAANQEDGEQAEEEHIKEYWASFEDPSTQYYISKNWAEYKDQHGAKLLDLFANFLEILIRYKDHPNWARVDIDNYLNKKNARNFLGKTPSIALTKIFGVKKASDLSLKNAEGKAESIAKADGNFTSFEINVLFNLYKNQQKHEFDYFYYKK